jgi:hypothetical protein
MLKEQEGHQEQEEDDKEEEEANRTILQNCC